MSQDYLLPKGTSLRFSPARPLDPVLRNEIEGFFNAYVCLKAFCVCSVKRGWFSREISTLCIVHDNAEAYSQAHADLGRRLTAYFSAHPGFIDYMGFDWSNTEHRAFVEALMARIPFVRKEEELNRTSGPTLTVCPQPSAEGESLDRGRLVSGVPARRAFSGVSLQPKPQSVIVVTVVHF